MQQYSQNSRILLLIFMMMIIPLACQFPGKTTELPAETIPVSSESAQSLEENLKSALAAAKENGEFQIEVTEQQLTSWVTLQMDNDSAYPIENLQIFLREGQIKVTGQVNDANMKVGMEIVMDMRVSQDHRLEYDIVSAKVGPFNIPQSLLDEMKGRIQAAFDQQMQSLGTSYQIDRLEIRDGIMTIEGIIQ
jgi:hypothetical protein